jgi:hypothetical protein
MKNNFFNLSLHKIDYMAAKLGSNDIWPLPNLNFIYDES